MLLPNTDSFVLKRRSIVKPSFSVFLPNSDSFVLIRGTIIKSSPPPETINAINAIEATPQLSEPPEQADLEQTEVSDEGRRKFLKVAGVVGAGVIASQFSPKKAQAFIMGSSPTTGVVGVKDSTNLRIDPATEGTLDEVLKTSDLSLTAGVLDVKVTSVSGEGSSSFSDSGDVARSALVDELRHVQVDVLSSALPTTASTEDTLETISFGGTQFTLRLETDSGDSNIDYVGEAVVGSGGEGDAVWRIKKIDSTSGIVIKWADGDAGLNNTWTGYAGHTYL